MIVIFTGLPGAGKSQKMAHVMIDTLYRNRQWYEKSGKKRQVWSNMRLNFDVEREFIGYINYWEDPRDLTGLRDVDVFWDEIATHLDSTQWQNMSLEIKRWLQQHRKFGIEIYGTTQDFAMIDKSMRRMTSDLFILTKLFGSRDKSSTKPEVKYIWGLVLIRGMDATQYDESKSKQQGGFPSIMLLTRQGVELFNTTQEIKRGKYPPLNHIERECADPGCTFHKVIHA